MKSKAKGGKMQLREALSDIAQIRSLLDRNQAYRGFRSIAIGISAVFVLMGSLVQLSADLAHSPSRYLDIWLCVALGSLMVTAVEMIVRGRKSNDTSVWKMHGKLAISILPCFVVGALLTATLVLDSKNPMHLVRDNLWLLPGSWALIYSLGLFACCNLLHRTTRIAAIYYLLAGCTYLLCNWKTHQISAWHMVAIFGVGQLVLAAILYWKVERHG